MCVVMCIYAYMKWKMVCICCSRSDKASVVSLSECAEVAGRVFRWTTKLAPCCRPAELWCSSVSPWGSLWWGRISCPWCPEPSDRVQEDSPGVPGVSLGHRQQDQNWELLLRVRLDPGFEVSLVCVGLYPLILTATGLGLGLAK